MPNLPRVAIIIVNYNAGALLAHCVASVLQQTYTNYRLIIADNASQDDSIEQLALYAGRFELLSFPNNLGFAVANNHAVEKAMDCEWIALLNPDTVAQPDWLEKLVEASQAKTEFSTFASQLRCAQDTRYIDGIGDDYYMSGLPRRHGHGQLMDKVNLRAREVFSACAAAALYRRKIFLTAGGFDETFFCYLEDVDLGFRLQLMGERCWYVETAIVEHHGSAITGKHSDFSVYYGHRNLVWAFFKNMPSPLFWYYLPCHVFLNLLSLVWFGVRGQGKVIFKAKWDALWGLPRIWRKRQEIQIKRTASLQEIKRVIRQDCGRAQ